MYHSLQVLGLNGECHSIRIVHPTHKKFLLCVRAIGVMDAKLYYCVHGFSEYFFCIFKNVN